MPLSTVRLASSPSKLEDGRLTMEMGLGRTAMCLPRDTKQHQAARLGPDWVGLWHRGRDAGLMIPAAGERKAPVAGVPSLKCA